MHIVKKLGALGAEVGGIDLSQPLDAGTASEIVQLWLEHLVLVFRGQKLDDAALVQFSRRFGELEKAPLAESARGISHTEVFPEVTTISNVILDGKPLGALGDGELVWHSDMTYLPVPPPASMLYSIEVPAEGGDTWFNNMYKAYETLPETLKRRIEGLRANHDSSHTSAGTLRKGFVEETDVSRAPGAKHPLVITHPDTGRKALYLGRRRLGYVMGLTVAESESLLDELWAHAEQPELAISHRWQPGDLVMWDNRCVMHRRDAFDPAARRILHRTQLLSFEAR